MIIASIDIQNGKVVQLKQGEELVLQRDNAGELAEEFDRCGEVAVIDLDAAMGKGNNSEMIKPLLRKAECRVGGGIRTPEQAKELVSLGARRSSSVQARSGILPKKERALRAANSASTFRFWKLFQKKSAASASLSRWTGETAKSLLTAGKLPPGLTLSKRPGQ